MQEGDCRAQSTEDEAMMKIDKVLVPVDFSEQSKTAVRYGLAIALQFDAPLVLAHIVPTSTALTYTFPAESCAFEKEQAKDAKSTLPELVPAAFRDRVNLQTIVKIGDVESELRSVIEDKEISLVVMGTHGRNVLGRLFLGSVTEHMLRTLQVPVLTVCRLRAAKELKTAGPVRLNHLLYATDLAETDSSGWSVATELARASGASLSVLHVRPSVQDLCWSAEAGYLSQQLATLRKDSEERLWAGIRRHAATGVNITAIVKDGEPSREILRTASEMDADLIVIDVRRKNIAERTLLGTTAERVIRSAEVPVLSVPSMTSRQKNGKRVATTACASSPTPFVDHWTICPSP
jgi:nucleotide-binding universal stress UspA family protein